jgi:hypothetical protein
MLACDWTGLPSRAGTIWIYLPVGFPIMPGPELLRKDLDHLPGGRHSQLCELCDSAVLFAKEHELTENSDEPEIG